MVARLLLIGGRFQRFFQCRGNFPPFVWINDNRFWKFLGGAGHLAENQHTGAITPGCHIFFGNQVHAVA